LTFWSKKTVDLCRK